VWLLNSSTRDWDLSIFGEENLALKVGLRVASEQPLDRLIQQLQV
jgi:hypothetical protein